MAANTDKFMKQGRSTATTLSAPGYAEGVSTSINVGSTTNWPTDTGVVFAIDEVDSSGNRVDGTYNVFVGTVASATQISNVDYLGGDTERSYSAGATTRVYLLVSSLLWNRMVDGLLVSHDQDGTLKAGAVDEYGVLSTLVKRYTSAEYAPQGYMQNGKISRTVASNNITVAIKTLAGTDPSSTDPVLIRIGDTVRTITSALSVTKNAGTNWFNSGAASTATQEIDYFVYLGYNATDGVTVGFARIPYARTYGDFSTTTTNDKYCAISTITNASSSDEYEVVGRFNATLSASASFNWSIPATSVVINRPIFNTRELVFTPQIAGVTDGSATKAGRYVIDDDRMSIKANWIYGAGSAVTTIVIMTTPMTMGSTCFQDGTVTLGHFHMTDNGVAQYHGGVRWRSTTTVDGVAFLTSGTYAQAAGFTSSVPFTWGSSDSFTFVFEVGLV